MSRSGYDAVVDVDDEVGSLSPPRASRKLNRPLAPTPSSPFPLLLVLNCYLPIYEARLTVRWGNHRTGRPRAHGSPGRPRVPQLQLLRVDAGARHQRGPGQAVVGLAVAAAPGHGGRWRVVAARRRRGQALPVDAVVLRPVLRRGHDVGAAPLRRRPLPARKLPRRARG